MNHVRPSNDCGNCTACCVVMPILSEEFSKVAGKPCGHLCGDGCGIYPERPPVCRSWYCIWRLDAWMGRHPDYRPDRLGVMFSSGDEAMALWEVTPGALADPRVEYIRDRLKNRYKAPDVDVRRYPLGVLKLAPTQEMMAKVNNGTLRGEDAGCRWQKLGGNEYVLVPAEGRD